MGFKLKALLFVILISILAFRYLSQEGNFEHLQSKHKFRVYKDEHGVPRIYAKDKHSALYGLGFAEAQDRLWTLHLKKMIIQGRLS